MSSYTHSDAASTYSYASYSTTASIIKDSKKQQQQQQSQSASAPASKRQALRTWAKKIAHDVGNPPTYTYDKEEARRQVNLTPGYKSSLGGPYYHSPLSKV